MPGKKQVTRRAALGLVAGGGLLAATETFGFSNVTAGRGVSVDTASDANALLGMENLQNTDKVPLFRNQTGGQMDITLENTNPDVTVEFDVGNDGNKTEGPVTFTLAPGASVKVNVLASASEVTVDVTGVLLDGGTQTGRIDLSRNVKIPEAGQVAVTPNVKSTGNSGKYKFELENTGDVDVTITGIGIRETTEQTAVKVGGKNNDGILKVAGSSVMSTIIPIDSNDSGNATIVGFDQNVPLTTGATKTFEFDRFRDSSNNGAKMKGAAVKTVLEFSDGSTVVVNLRP